MIRAGVVDHPSQWGFCGYSEIQAPRERYALIDYEGLKGLLGFKSMHDFAETYRRWVEESLKKGNQSRDQKWTESIAVGSETFVKATKERLGFKARGREVIGGNGSYVLRESPASYNAISGHENDALRPENAHFWDHNL